MKSIQKNKVFVIAEMANSYEGHLSIAKQITESAANAGADAIKFQKFTATELVESSHENFDLFKKLEMTNKEWIELVNYAKSKKLNVFVDIFEINSAQFISKLKIDGYKLHSSDIGTPDLLNF